MMDSSPQKPPSGARPKIRPTRFPFLCYAQSLWHRSNLGLFISALLPLKDIT